MKTMFMELKTYSKLNNSLQLRLKRRREIENFFNGSSMKKKKLQKYLLNILQHLIMQTRLYSLFQVQVLESILVSKRKH